MFTYKELLYIKAVSQEKSISKAAEKLYISQPSLSQAIIQIEKRLGEKILLRSKDGIKLTYLGERYLKMANDIVNIYADFNNDITKINDLKMGEIKIGITRFMGMYLLPHILPEFSKMYPNIQIYIEEEESRILEKKLLNMSIDFAIMHMNPLNINTKLSYEKLCEDRFIIVSKKK